MIYLIGGAPRIGKSIIGRELAQQIGGELVSTDDLDMSKSGVMWPGFSGNPAENITTPSERVNLQTAIATACEPVIEACIVRGLKENKNIVIEGILLLPVHVSEWIKQYNAKAIFIGWKNADAVLMGMSQNNNPNDWLKEANEAVRRQVSEFTVAFSEYVEVEAKKYDVTYIERTDNFKRDIQKIISLVHVI